jgi:hypothetical protein
MRDVALRRLGRLAGASELAVLAGDLWRLTALRRGVRLGQFATVATLEEGGRRLVLTTRLEDAAVDGTPRGRPSKCA